MVEALRYKSEGRGFDFRCPYGLITALGSTQPLAEMSTRDISCGKGGRCVGLTPLPPSYADCLEILGASSSCSPDSLYSVPIHVLI
jgi:hypothetical protein